MPRSTSLVLNTLPFDSKRISPVLPRVIFIFSCEPLEATQIRQLPGCREPIFDAVDSLYRLFERIRLMSLLVAQVELGRWRRADQVLRLSAGTAPRMADKGVEHVIQRELQAADFFEHAREHFVGDALAIDQHAVTIER